MQPKIKGAEWPRNPGRTEGRSGTVQAKHGVVPGLYDSVGENPASQSYVRGKQKTAHELGFHSVQDNQPADLSEEKLLQLVDQYNKDPQIHGILVQLPLPKHINENRVLLAIDPSKDVDAFHPVNVGKLLIGEPDYLPCTPAGIQELLVRFRDANLAAGRSGRGGGAPISWAKPIARHLMREGQRRQCDGCRVHTRTARMSSITRRARLS